jgi:hypothetical protein
MKPGDSRLAAREDGFSFDGSDEGLRIGGITLGNGEPTPKQRGECQERSSRDLSMGSHSASPSVHDAGPWKDWYMELGIPMVVVGDRNNGY